MIKFDRKKGTLVISSKLLKEIPDWTPGKMAKNKKKPSKMKKSCSY